MVKNYKETIASSKLNISLKFRKWILFVVKEYESG